MDIQLAGGSYAGDDPALVAQRTINLFPEVVEARARSQLYLRRTPGLTAAREDLSGPCRAIFLVREFVYIVAGTSLYRYQPGGQPTTLGTIPGSQIVRGFASDDHICFVNDANDGYVLTLSNNAFTQITDADFPEVIDVVYLDGYWIWAQAGSRRFITSSLNNPLQYNGLDFAAKEGDPNPIAGLAVSHNELFLIGETNSEPWRNVGNPRFPFAPLQGAETDRGCVSKDTIQALDNSFYFLGDDRVVYRMDGYVPRRVSTHWLEKELQTLDAQTISRASADAFTRDGHFFYALTAGQLTAVYDATVSTQTGQAHWHERRSALPTTSLEAQTPWRACGIVEAFGAVYCGDRYDGTLGILDDTEFTEYGNTIKCTRVTAPIFSDVQFLTIHRLEVRAKVGFSDLGRPGLLFMESSKDGGRTWSVAKGRSLGDQGEYDIRLIWRRLGRSVDRIFRFSCTDAVDFSLYSGHINADARL